MVFKNMIKRILLIVIVLSCAQVFGLDRYERHSKLQTSASKNDLVIYSLNKYFKGVHELTSFGWQFDNLKIQEILFLKKQVNDTIKAKDKQPTKKDSFLVNYFYKKSLDSSLVPSGIKLNNSLDGTQLYNPLFEENFFPVILGNIGQAYKSLVFSPRNNMGFDIGLNSFDGYFYNENNVRYYQVRKPFSEASTVLGAKKEQFLHIKHYQNINKLVNIGLDYSIASSLGQYTWQKSYITNFNFSSSYFSKNKRYAATGCFIINRLKVQENGGVLDTSNFADILYNNVNLYVAQNKIRETAFNIKQYYNLEKIASKNDTTKSNEQLSINNEQFKAGRISLDVSWDREYQVYTDTGQHKGFYPAPVYDKVTTSDSIIFYKISGNIGWHPYINSKKTNQKIIDFYFNLKSEEVFLFNKYAGKNKLLQLTPSAGFATNSSKRISIWINAEYVTGNYNDGDYKLCGGAILKTGKSRDSINQLKIKGYYINKTPAWFENRYQSNYFHWSNNFSKSTTTYMSLTYLYKKLGVSSSGYGVDYYSLNNYVYFNETGLPTQADRNITVLAPYLYKKLIIGNFELFNKVVYQNISHSEIIRLPRFVIYESLLYNLKLFKSNLILQIGTDFWYTSKYYADSYIPAIRQFCIQNKKEIGENISFDPFINLRIKRAKLFVKYQHINYSFSNIKTYQAPYYPLQDAALKFGVQWRFYD